MLGEGNRREPEPLIAEGEGIPLEEAVRDFVRAGEHLLEIQRQTEPMGCSVLKSVRVDGLLGLIVSQYRGSLDGAS
jgi:hypothetical protein